MNKISLDYSKVKSFVTDEEIKSMEDAVANAHKTLTDGTG